MIRPALGHQVLRRSGPANHFLLTYAIDCRLRLWTWLFPISSLGMIFKLGLEGFTLKQHLNKFVLNKQALNLMKLFSK